MAEQEVKTVSYWCYAVKRQVQIEGEIVGRRAAELLDVTDCTEEGCPKRRAIDCLIGKVREGRWL